MKTIEKFTNFIGEKASYLIPVMTIMMVIVIISRYFFGIGRTGMQELVMYFHAAVFLGCAGFVFNKDEHVRVDIFYRESSTKYKNLINSIFGFIFLLPVVAVIFIYSLEVIYASWGMKEVSTESGGLDYVYVQKTFILLFPLTLIAALINQLIKLKWK